VWRRVSHQKPVKVRDYFYVPRVSAGQWQLERLLCIATTSCSNSRASTIAYVCLTAANAAVTGVLAANAAVTGVLATNATTYCSRHRCYQ